MAYGGHMGKNELRNFSYNIRHFARIEGLELLSVEQIGVG
jgi:hypothetical protein